MTTKTYYLNNYLPRNSHPTTLFSAARRRYPESLLPRNFNLYIINNNFVLSEQWNDLHFNNLEDLLRNVESTKRNTVVVSFGKNDFDKFDGIATKPWEIRRKPNDNHMYLVHWYVPTTN